jgi:lipid II:glycine glycyltransferase (peptidoglycan interpeptide bridge formation enzyme)
MSDIRQSGEYADYLKQTGWVVEKIDGVFVFIKKFPLVAMAKVQRAEELPLQKIYDICKKHKVVYLVVEPSDSIASLRSQSNRLRRQNDNLKLSKNPYLPTKTLELGLTWSEKKLYENLKKDCRYAIRKTDNLKLIEPEISSFRSAWREAAPSGRYVMSEKNLIVMRRAFGKKMLLIATEDLSAGGIFLVANKKGYYWHGFSNAKGRRGLAQYKVVWEGILWAKHMGAKRFDFEGIYDPRFPLENWKGLTKFKKKFSGEEIDYPGAYVKWLWRNLV